MDVWVLERHSERRPWYQPRVIGIYGSDHVGMAAACPDLVPRKQVLAEGIARLEESVLFGRAGGYVYEDGFPLHDGTAGPHDTEACLRILRQEQRRLDFWEADDADHLRLRVNPDAEYPVELTLTRHLVVG